MTLAIRTITFDCADAHRVAAFWAKALDAEVDEGGDPDFCSIGRHDGSSPSLFFVAVPEAKSCKNRVHLDLETPDRASEVVRLLGLGAQIVAEKAAGPYVWTIMGDVEGNEFCVSEPHHAEG